MNFTPRQRVEAVLKGEIADRIPFTAYENKVHRCAVERQLRAGGMCIVQRQVPVYKTVWPNVKITTASYTENCKHMVRTDYLTPVGNLFSIEEPTGFTSWAHKRLFSGPQDYKALNFLVNDMQFVENYNAFSHAQDMDGGDSFFRGDIGLEPMQQLISVYMGSEVFCMEWYDNRDELLNLYNALVQKRRQVYPLCAQSPALLFNYGGNVTPEILGLDRFLQFYVPHYNEAADVLHKNGKLVGVHFDANCRLIADAIAQTQLDCIEAFTPAPDTDMTLSQAKACWQNKILWVNFPSSVHLENINFIQNTVKDLLKQVGSPEKFIMGITEDVPEDRWQGNFLAIQNTLSEHHWM